MHSSTAPSRPLHRGILFGTALLVTLFLYSIDEGRFSLGGLLTVGNIITMSLYLLGVLAGLFAMDALLARRAPSPGRTAMVLALGTIMGVALTIGPFFVLHGSRLPS